MSGLIDYSYLNPVKPTDPTTEANNWLDLRNKQMQLQQQNANALAGQAAQGAIDPSTGEFNPNTYRTLLQQAGPKAALAAQAGLANTQTISSNELEQQRAKWNMVHSAAGALLDLPNPSRDDAVRAVNSIPGLSDADRQRAIATIPQDSAGIKIWAAQHQLTGLQMENQIQQQSGTTGTATAPGGALIGTQQAPARKGGAISAPAQHGVQQGMTPAEGAQPVTYTDKNNVTQHTTLQEYGNAVNRGDARGPAYDANGRPVQLPGGGGSGSSTAVPPAPPGATVRSPGSYQPRGGGGAPNATAPPAAAPATPASDQPQPRSISGPETGEAGQKEQSATQFAAARDAAGNYQQRLWPMVQSYHLLAGGDVTTGQGADFTNKVKSYLQTLGTIFTPADMQSIQQADFDKLGKYLQQAVNAQPFAAGTNDKLAAAITGSPNTHISTLANKDVVSAMIAQERMKQAAYLDFTDQGQPANKWGDFLAKWQTTHDPRAFLTDMIGDDSKLKKMFASMSPSERTAYANTMALIKGHPDVMNMSAMP